MFVNSTKNRASNSTIKQIKAQYEIDMTQLLRKEDVLESIKTTDKKVFILRNGVPIFILQHDRYIPTVKCVHLIPDIAKKVVVDVGAIKYLINGADVMAPGLLHRTSDYPAVQENEVVSVYGYGKTHALGVGVVQMDNQQVEQIKSGVAIKMLSHLGDKTYLYSCS